MLVGSCQKIWSYLSRSVSVSFVSFDIAMAQITDANLYIHEADHEPMHSGLCPCQLCTTPFTQLQLSHAMCGVLAGMPGKDGMEATVGNLKEVAQNLLLGHMADMKLDVQRVLR